MKIRIITAIAALSVFVPVLYFSETIAFPVTVSLLCVVAIYELFSCVNMRKCRLMFVTSVIYAASLPVIARFYPSFVFPCTCLYVCFSIASEVVYYNKFSADLVGCSAFQTIAIALGLSLMIVVRDRQSILYLLIFVAAWGTDTFAYFAGVLFGKRKLCPEISPKKTVAGAVGGVVGCAIGFVVFGIVCNTWFNCEFSYAVLAVIAIPLSACGQIGDLAASTVKRHFGIKDYGKLFPGHGGVLDRFDSILPITLFAFILTEFALI